MRRSSPPEARFKVRQPHGASKTNIAEELEVFIDGRQACHLTLRLEPPMKCLRSHVLGFITEQP